MDFQDVTEALPGEEVFASSPRRGYLSRHGFGRVPHKPGASQAN
jgi:hypothetical protein